MDNLLSKLEVKKKEIIGVATKLFPPERNLYYFDLYCVAQLNRSINLLDGYIDLAKKDNFIAALPLLRLHLDTLQRMYAFQLIDKDIDEIVREILGGKQIKHYQNKFNKRKLSDAELNEQLSSFTHFSWVKNVYSAGNDFVHFSDKHILISTIIEDKDNLSFSSTISLGSSYVAEKEKEGSCIYMGKITDGILFFINRWIEHKGNY